MNIELQVEIGSFDRSGSSIDKFIVYYI